MQLTNDAEKMLCSLYKVYLNRRKDGFTKAESREFEESYFHANEPFSKMDIDDVYDTMQELYRHGYLFMDITGNCELTTEAVARLESRFKNGLVDVLSFLAQLIP